jgi:hypothetical protein
MQQFIQNILENTLYKNIGFGFADIITIVNPIKQFRTTSIFDSIEMTESVKSAVPLAFSIPDECIVDAIPKKTRLLAPLIPGDASTYVFDKTMEKEYNEMYRESRFAITMKKGGWDCLRHYEIMMNGCIPLFEKLDQCPETTLTTYPKHLNVAAFELYRNWDDSNECIEKYNKLCNQFLDHTRQYCTSSAAAKRFLGSIKNGDKVRNVLLITCNCGVNYAREMLWIGLKRYITELGGSAVEHDKMPYLYTDFDDALASNYYGNNCFTFPKRLQKDADYDTSEAEILDKIRDGFWDLIIYGKVGPDEYCYFPHFDTVKQHYTGDKLAFIFPGDEPFNMKNTDPEAHHVNMFGRHIRYKPYTDYLNYYRQLGTCFVRELEDYYHTLL